MFPDYLISQLESAYGPTTFLGDISTFGPIKILKLVQLTSKTLKRFNLGCQLFPDYFPITAKIIGPTIRGNLGRQLELKAAPAWQQLG